MRSPIQNLVEEPEWDPAGADAPRFLRLLFTGRHASLHALASRVFGIGGVLLIAILSAVLAGLPVQYQIDIAEHDRVATGFAVPLVYGAVCCTVLAMQLIISARAPLTIQLFLIYGLVILVISAITKFGVSPESIPLCCLICAGGFALRHGYGWTCLSWGQGACKGSRKLSIATLLDLTAAIALTLALLSAGNQDAISRFIQGSICMLPGGCLIAVFGLLPWFRLLNLATTVPIRDLGSTLWFGFNVLIALVAFAMIAKDDVPLALLVAVAMAIVAHLQTAIMLAWLRLCGWTVLRDLSKQQQPE